MWLFYCLVSHKTIEGTHLFRDVPGVCRDVLPGVGVAGVGLEVTTILDQHDTVLTQVLHRHTDTVGHLETVT